MKLLLIFAIFILQVNAATASDSTLYKERIQKLKDFSYFLKAQIIDVHNKFDFDSSSPISKFYDTAIAKYFNSNLLNSRYLSNGDIDIETPEFNLKFLKNCIATLHSLSLTSGFKKIKFRPATHPFLNTEPITLDYSMLTNSIIYYTIDESNIHDHLAFIFEPNKSILIGIVAMPYTK